MFGPRIWLMGHPRPQFRAKADLPVGFPYRFNSSFFSVFTDCWIITTAFASRRTEEVYLPFEFPVCASFLHLLNFSHVQQIWPISALSETTKKKVKSKLIKCIFSFSQQRKISEQNNIQLLSIFFRSDASPRQINPRGPFGTRPPYTQD